jgi:hypothetical protein
MSFKDVEASKSLMRRDFIESEFYEEEMDDITDFGMRRGIMYVLSLMNAKSEIEHRISDPFDAYVDVRAQTKKDIRGIVFTFTNTIQEMKEKYPADKDGVAINWDTVRQDMEKSLSEEKNKMNALKEPKNKDIFLLRE